MSDVKKPLVGEWWRTKCGEIRYVIADTSEIIKCKANLLVINKRGSCNSKHADGRTTDYRNTDYDLVEHLPDCTGFDWVPETFPQYWTTVDVNSSVAFLKRTSAKEYCFVEKNGFESPTAVCSAMTLNKRKQLTEAEALALLDPPKPVEVWPKYYVGYQWNYKDAYIRYDGPESSGVWVNWHGTETVFANDDYSEVAKMVASGSWRQVTEAEAKLRVTKPKPVESPDDWVEITQTHPNHIPRIGIDWFTCVETANIKTDAHWRMQGEGHSVESVGEFATDWRGRHRCRRKDLPPLPDAAPQPQWQTIEIGGKRYEIREAQEVIR